MEEKFQNIEKHFRKPTSLHRRIPSKSENDLLLHKINNTCLLYTSDAADD